MAIKWQANSTVTYFIQAAHGGPIKVGRSTTEEGAQQRLASLQTGSPYPLILCRVMFGDHERQLHARFAEHRLMGEWFTPVKELALLANGKAEEESQEIVSVQEAFMTGYRRGHLDGTQALSDCMEGWIEDIRNGADILGQYLAIAGEKRDPNLLSGPAFKEFLSELRSNTAGTSESRAVVTSSSLRTTKGSVREP